MSEAIAILQQVWSAFSAAASVAVTLMCVVSLCGSEPEDPRFAGDKLDYRS